MIYDDVVQEILAIPKFGRTPNSDNLKKYLDMLEHPEDALRVIHVAGTNGKGSVCAFTESILRKAGYRTALFTSPHLVQINERIRVNGEPCTNDAFVRAYEEIQCLYRTHSDELEPLTYFALLYLMSLLIFKEADPDYCIMETGLGGRLDATNTTKPILSIITSISMDHTDVLGETIEEIAGEKAGIIKPGIPVLVIREARLSSEEAGFDPEQAYRVIRNRAEALKSPLFTLTPIGEGRFEISPSQLCTENVKSIKIQGTGENLIDFSGITDYYENDTSMLWRTPTGMENAAMAMTAVRILQPDMEEDLLIKGILGTNWSGRMEHIGHGIYLDGAHNPGAVLRVLAYLRTLGQEKIAACTLLFAVCSDKDYTAMIRMLSEPAWKEIIITRTRGVRGAKIADVADTFVQRYHGPVTCCESVREAYEILLSRVDASEDAWGMCLGSLYLVGEIKEQINI